MIRRAHDEACGCDLCFTARLEASKRAPPSEGLIMAILHCPSCARRHYDEGEWRTRPHRRHQCAHCRFRWLVVPLCIGAHDCDWHECFAVAVKLRHELGGGEAHLCERHELEGEGRGFWRPLTAEVSP